MKKIFSVLSLVVIVPLLGCCGVKGGLEKIDTGNTNTPDKAQEKPIVYQK